MDKIDAGVRLQQIAPGALAGMGFAGDQQNAKLVAHAVDGYDCAIVDLRELVFQCRGLDLDDVRTGMRDLHIHADVRAHAHIEGLDRLAVAAHRYLGGARRSALILDPKRDGLRLADDPEPRSSDEHDAAVALILVAGNEGMRPARQNRAMPPRPARHARARR